jgi:hypothetical protein
MGCWPFFADQQQPDGGGRVEKRAGHEGRVLRRSRRAEDVTLKEATEPSRFKNIYTFTNV